MASNHVFDERKPVVVSALPFQDLASVITESADVPAGELLARLARWLEESRQPREGQSVGWLTIQELVEVCRPGRSGKYRKVELDPAALDAVRESRDEVDRCLAEGKLVYGVTTGFGSFRRFVFDDPEDARLLSGNILFSHATGLGRPLPIEVVRAMLLLRLRTFAQGNSGVSEAVVWKLQEMLNAGVVPYVPEKGSVGCSGDLCTLAHLFLVMVGEGRGWVLREADNSWWEDGQDPREYRLREDRLQRWKEDPWVLLEGRQAMQLAGVEPLEVAELRAKDGLSLTNGAVLAAALLALASHDAGQLYRTANVGGSLTHQALFGLTRAFEARVGAVRPHAGQILTAWEMVHLLEEGTLHNRSALIGEAQDDYSIRAIPQVHGSVWDAIAQVRRVVEIEINSATDNPLFFGHYPGSFQFDSSHLPASDVESTLQTTHCAAANFHGEPLALASDQLKIAVAELASIAERRIQLLLDPDHNRGLPGNLALGARGLHSGFMLTQYAAASLVAENKVLCHPSSVDSIPTSANAEDHVSMAANAARHLRQVVENVARVLSIEILCALQALDIRTALLGSWTEQQMRLAGADPTDARQAEAFVMKQWGELAPMILPEWANRSRGTSGSVEWLTARGLKLSGAAARVHALVRLELEVPLIVGDGFCSADEEAVPLQSPVPVSTFRERAPHRLVETVVGGVRTGAVVAAAWPSRRGRPS